MNDVFLERMVKKKLEAVDFLIIAAVLAGILAATALGIFLGFLVLAFPMISVLITAGAVFGGYKLICSRLLEYEISLTNGFVAVDKIMNRASRKRLTSFECNSCEDIGRYEEQAQRLKNQSFDQRIFITRTSAAQGAWYMTVRSAKTGKTLLVFEADDELLDAVKQFIPRQLKFEKFGRG